MGKTNKKEFLRVVDDSGHSRRGTRVDRPHEDLAPASELSPPAARQNPIATDDLEALKRLITRARTQSAQLARCLQKREKELNRREAALNAQSAVVESSVRSSRLWIAEHSFELNEQRKLLEHTNQSAIEERAEALASEKLQHLESLRAKYDEQLRLAHANLERRRASLEDDYRRRESMFREPSPAQVQKENDLRQMATGLLKREDQLVQAERILARQKGELEIRREELALRKDQLEGQARQERRHLADEQRRWHAEAEKEKQLLARQREEFDARYSAMDRMREDVMRVQRETLEYRLAIEELWGQLSGVIAPETLTRSLGRIRARLTDHYRLYETELSEKKRELEELADRLAGEHSRIRQYKQRLHEWANRQQEITDERAERLVRREQELERQDAEHQELLLNWQNERQGYQDEIQRLLRQAATMQPIAA